MICFHGTTMKNLKAMLGGCKDKPAGGWNVSCRDNLLYVWTTDGIIDSNCLEDYPDDAEEIGIQRAFESAEVQAIVDDETEIVAIILNIPDEELSEDSSCENMQEAACITCGTFDPNMIVSVYQMSLNRWRFPMTVSALIGNKLFDSTCLDEGHLAVAEAHKESKQFFEPTEFYDRYEISIPECEQRLLNV